MGLQLLAKRFDRTQLITEQVQLASRPWVAMPEEQRRKMPFAASRLKPDVGLNTTLVAYRVKDKVILAADGLMTSGGGRVERENVNKIEILDARAAMACCGYMTPAKICAKIVREIFARFENEFQKPMPPADMADVIGEVASTIYQFSGLDVYPLFVAYDENKQRSRIFDIWASGGGDEKADYWTNGSGGDGAMSYIRNAWPKMTEEEELMLGVAAVHAAQHKVTSANNTHRMLIIGQEPIKEIPLKKLQALLDEFKKKCPDCQYQNPKRGYIQS